MIKISREEIEISGNTSEIANNFYMLFASLDKDENLNAMYKASKKAYKKIKKQEANNSGADNSQEQK